MPRQFGRFLLPATSFPVSDLPFTWPEEGLFTAWHENGQKKSETTFKDGKKVSETKWDKEGNEIKIKR